MLELEGSGIRVEDFDFRVRIVRLTAEVLSFGQP